MPADRPFLVALYLASERDLRRIDGRVDRTVTAAQAEALVRRGFRFSWARRSLLYIAEVDGVRAGFVIAGPANDIVLRAARDPARAPKIAEIYELHMTRACRRQGVASALLKAAERDLTRVGFTEIGLNFSAGNMPASSLYSKTGYRPKETIATKRLSAPGRHARRVGE